MYNWLRRRYIAQLEVEIEDMIENENIDPDIAENYFIEKLQEWEDGYGDYMYDLKGDR